MAKHKFLFLFLGLLLLTSFVAAWDPDNVLRYEPAPVDEITIKNAFGLPFIGDDILKATLNENFCDEQGRYCEAIKTITLYTDEALVQDFRTLRLDDGSNSEQDIRWSKIEYWGDIDDYEYQCTDTEETSINGTVIQECSNVIVGSHEGWIRYNLDTIMPAGTYEVRTSGEIKPGRVYDWQILIAGEWSTPWAIWGNISLGDEAEVILNSPTDGATAYVNNQLFNSTANITLASGATLVNMSLWTNENGSWTQYNTTTFEDIATQPSPRMTSSTTPSPYEIWSSTEAGGNEEWKAYDGNTTYPSTWVSSTDPESVPQWLAIDLGVNQTLTSLTTYFDITGSSDMQDFEVQWSDDKSSWTTIYSFTHTQQTGNVTYSFTNNTLEKQYYRIYITTDYGAGGGVRAGEEIWWHGDATTSSTQTWNRTITDTTLWNVQACDTDGDCGFATSNYTVSVDTTAPTINILYPSTIFDALAQDQNVSLNYTITDSNIDSCWYEYNNTNTTTSCTENSSFLYELNENSITLWANDSVGNTNSSSVSWGVKIRENSQTFSSSTVEGAIENFTANVTIDPSIEISSAILVYNGTEVSGTFTSDGQERLLTVDSYTIPDFAADTNATFYWEVTLTDATEINLSTQTQLVQSVGLDNCSSYTNQLFNISLFNEETLVPLNGTIELLYSVLNKPDYDTIQTLSTKLIEVNNTLVCSDINLSGSGLAYSVEMKYYSTGFASELYHVQKADINGIQPVSLYDLNNNDSTEFKITYQDDNFVFVEGAVVQLQRKYISEDIYRVVEAPLTSSEGTAVLHIDLDSVKYKVTVVKDGVVLDTFDNIVFKCQSVLTGECEQKLLGTIDPQNTIDYDTERDFTYSVTAGENNVTIAYSIPSSTPSSVNIFLTQKDQFGNTTQCNKTVLSSAGSIQCPFNDTLSVSYLELGISKDGIPVGYNTYVVDEDTGMDFLDNNYLIVVVLMLSLVGMALTSPEWMVLNALITLLLSGMLWLVNGIDFVAGLGILMWLVIAAGILILKLSKQEDK